MAVSKAETDGAFEPCVWGDFFATYTPPISQGSEEWMRQRTDQLKGEVRRMFEAVSMADTVDTLEHLGIDNHLREEIAAALRRVQLEEMEFGGSNDLHIVALQER